MANKEKAYAASKARLEFIWFLSLSALVSLLFLSIMGLLSPLALAIAVPTVLILAWVANGAAVLSHRRLRSRNEVEVLAESLSPSTQYGINNSPQIVPTRESLRTGSPISQPSREGVQKISPLLKQEQPQAEETSSTLTLSSSL